MNRRGIATRSVVALAATLAAGLATAGGASAVPGPVNAGNTYKWGPIAQSYEFEGRHLARYWHKSGSGQMRIQHGMLTLNSATRGRLSATLARKGHRTGRWETRIRGRRFTSRRSPYRVVVALTPAPGHAQHCGASDVGLTSFTPNSNGPAAWRIRHLPDRQYTFTKRMSFRKDQWHTFAVEVKPHRIAWFVDAHSVAVEKNPAAMSHTPLTVRFTLRPTGSGAQDRSRMQMDWLRYWTLARHSALPVEAPAATEKPADASC